MRKLEIAEDRPAFIYQYKVCVKKFLTACRKTETRVEVYDLTDPKIRQRLRDMGFVAQVRDKAL